MEELLDKVQAVVETPGIGEEEGFEAHKKIAKDFMMGRGHKCEGCGEVEDCLGDLAVRLMEMLIARELTDALIAGAKKAALARMN